MGEAGILSPVEVVIKVREDFPNTGPEVGLVLSKGVKSIGKAREGGRIWGSNPGIV